MSDIYLCVFAGREVKSLQPRACQQGIWCQWTKVSFLLLIHHKTSFTKIRLDFQSGDWYSEFKT